ncbi:MAG: archaeosine biosynthesis radical SAM protein RaSEA, partial [Thermodesulfobacteriota bacterium]|nr:archaeosine biosynthesis radical SAM protein RaSEA [Thermodesulfobacteriota bacterium]
FLDEREVSKKSRNEILSKFSSYQNVKKIIVESRPEFIEKNVISDSMNHIGNFEIGIGVETSNDLIRDRCINKGFSFEDFVQAAEIAKECGASIKAYLLLKPPYLSEKEAIEDAIKSAIDVSNYASTISLNLCNIQNATKVYDLWKNGCYRPPWLWSAVEVIKRIKVDIEDKIVLSDPIGAGFNRGPHNCGRCDRTIADKIRKFSLLQDISIFDDVHCECEEIFKREMHLEEISFGSPLIL